MRLPGRPSNTIAAFSIFVMLSVSASGCKDSTVTPTTSTVACSTLTGTPWTPNVSGASSANHDGSVTVSKTVLTSVVGPITGHASSYTGANLFTFSIDMSTDLGTSGSLSLVAETASSGGITGGAFPVLVSLSDGTNEYVNLTANCASSGIFTSGLNDNAACKTAWPSAYNSREDWLAHNFLFTTAGASTATFPTCNYAGGTAAVDSTAPACAFTSNFLSGGKLVSGVNYTAKYVLIAPSYASNPGVNGAIKVTVVKKSDSAAGSRAIDLNVILVGNKNIQASHTTKGKQNLDSLFTAFHSYYSQANSNVKIGTINVYEWDCSNGGDAYADIALTSSSLLQFWQTGSALMPASTETKAVNIFLVSTIGGSGSGILGISGGIGGPMINGTKVSGAVFATFNDLATFNPNCNADPCPVTTQEASFVDMGETIAHEIGHYLGLFHPSESDGTAHDPLYDTPICTAIGATSGTQQYITANSCATTDTNVYGPTGKKCSQVCPGYTTGTFCPTALECGFNHIMWYSSKRWVEGTTTGDGKIFSPATGTVLNYNPFIR